MKYDSFRYLFPPRPSTAIHRSFLSFYEKKGWVAQIKKNGTSNVIAVSPDKKLICMSRHNDTHKQWAPTKESSEAFQDLSGNGWYVFTAELLHSKVVGLRDTNYIHDILVCDGQYLVGTTFQQRQEILSSLFIMKDGSHYRTVNPHTWVANSYKTGFMGLFDSLTDIEDEGLVLKDPKAKLALCSREASNNAWQVKSRRLTKNFGF